MIKHQIIEFIARWILSVFGMWICISLFGDIDGEKNIKLFILAGFIFSIINSTVRPLVMIFSLPLIVLTMGLFTFLINIATVSVAVWLIPGVNMDFTGAALSAITMSLVNGVVNLWISPYNIE